MILKIAAFSVAMLIWIIYKTKSYLHRKEPRMAVVYGLVMGVGFFAGVLWLANIYFPFTIAPARFLFEPIGKLILAR